MKDILVQEDLEKIKSKLRGRAGRQFCYYHDLNGLPEGTSEGKKILFSDGDTVRGESVLLDVSKGELRFEPLTPVQKPNPDSPPARGFKYVDADNCGKYSIDFMGMEYSFETFHDLMRGILKNVPESRNSMEELKYQIWVRAQDLDFSDRQDFRERISPGDIDRVLMELQIDRCVFPPTEPKELRKRFRRSSRGSRRYTFEEYVGEACRFYREIGEEKTADKLENGFSFSSNKDIDYEKVKRIVVEKVSEAY